MSLPSHSQKRYELRLQDEVLLVFTAARDPFGTVSVSVDEVVTSNLRLLPLPLWPDSRSGERLLSWLETRVIPKNRRFVDQILAQAGVTDDSTFGILDVCLGLSVNDAYWVVPHGFDGTWADYNLFENDLDEALALVAYTGYTTSQRHKAGLSSEWTTDGQFPKAWRRVDGELCLYKGGTEGFANSGMEPYSEFFAAQAAEAFGVPHVSYDLEEWKGRLASVCPLMHDASTAYVPFWTAAQQSLFPAALEAARRISEDAFDALRTMYVFDALVCNTDRHANNFGFLRNNLTGELVGMAPLFDHNLALFPSDMEQDYTSWPRQGSVRRPAGSNLTFDSVARLVMSEKHHEALRGMIDFRFSNHPVYPVPEKRLEALNRYVSQRVRQLLEINPVDERDLVGELRGVLPDDAVIPACCV